VINYGHASALACCIILEFRISHDEAFLATSGATTYQRAKPESHRHLQYEPDLPRLVSLLEADLMANIFPDSNKSGLYHFGLATYKVIAWIDIVLFAFCGDWAFYAHQYKPIWGFLGFVIVGFVILALSGNFEVDGESITHQCLVGRFRMLWRDVRQMEQGPGVLLLLGDKSRFVVPLGAWSGPDRHDAWTVFTQRVEASGIVPLPSNTAGYKWHKNVRVRN
jgi:hypothetical protein